MANESVASQLESYFYESNALLAKKVKAITKKHARALREKIKAASPVDTTSMDDKEHAVYKNGWRVSTSETALSIECVVHNYRRPSLTWLLEDGHLLENGSRTEAQPHIKNNGEAQGDLWLEELMNLDL